MDRNVENSQERDWSDSLVGELRRLAEIAMSHERVDHTLQPTALLNEAYLVLARQHNLGDADREAFLAAAATTIRRILVDHARRHNSKKRGGDFQRIPLQVSLPDYANDFDLLGVHEALTALAGHSERAARIVELRFFGGLTGEETARALDVSLRTVNNDWSFAKAWLYRRLGNLKAEADREERPI